MGRRAYVEVDVDQIKRNVKTILKNFNYEHYIGVVKGNGYGHGPYIAKNMVEAGLNYLAISTIDEALEVRQYVDKKVPLLCLQPLDFEHIELGLKENIAMTVSNYNYFKKLILKEEIKGLKIHLKLDTGMNRLGINKKEEVELIMAYCSENESLKLEGIYTHLASTGISDKRWDKQIEKFKFLISGIDLSQIPIIHLGGSSTLVYHPKPSFCNGIRIGIAFFGVAPRPLNNQGFKNQLRKIKRNLKRKFYHLSPIRENLVLDLHPGFSLISEVSEIKEGKKGECVGYGNNHIIKKDIKIAVIPIGYADGLSLKNGGRDVTINGYNYPIIGTVNMGMITIKVDDKVKENDKVIIIGNNVRYLCHHLKTSPHQLFSSISKSVPRIYIEKKKGIKVIKWILK